MDVKSSSGMLIDDVRGEMAVRGNPAAQRPAERAEDLRMPLGHGSASSLRPLPDHIIDDTVFLPLLGRHDVVPLGIFPNALERLPRVVHENIVEPVPQAQDFPRRDVDIGRLTGQMS
jgi:hypothetical protein